MIVDTHLHLIYRDLLSYPWLAGVPPLDDDFTQETYAREARRLGIVAALHMEVDVAEGDIARETAMIEGLAREAGSLLVGAIAACRPESPDFPAYLEAVLANFFVRGFRRVLHVVPDDVSEGALFRENIRRLAGIGLNFDLCVLPHQIGKAIALADLAPDVSFVLDHCGVPDIKGGGFDAWKGPVAEIARRPNVTVKLSGIPAYGAEDWTLEDLKPYFAHVVEHFGFERMVWGSDWPVCTLGGGLSTWIGATQALLSGVSLEDKRRVLSENAERLWKIAPKA
ncbi:MULTISPECIES: amidohydrolase [unclassified Shinella]|uniref:amidohydrolase family protein n=1 Tax=unclassified Shinella TaxID=2643062 RepID=UPI00225C6681|nr:MULTISPECIES: amidohydrolase [unclassified Shinella]MCO5140684.1 amidohydrolase [Shinella sp.]MDC7256626.1 amidohydrolase [Shinella sp. YE25]CAI0339503.1 Amidohydrolase [Rhizobiaceae bacterium]CAK7257901.1 L-fuconolactonase [Shinella sp. WSC3-e]